MEIDYGYYKVKIEGQMSGTVHFEAVFIARNDRIAELRCVHFAKVFSKTTTMKLVLDVAAINESTFLSLRKPLKEKFERATNTFNKMA